MGTGLALVATQPRDERWGHLVGRMAGGDQTALGKLYDATSAVVYGLVMRIVNDRALAEEVTGDVYLQAWQQAARYETSRGTPLTWLLAIARSRAIDRARVGVGWRQAQEPLEHGLAIACERPGPEDATDVEERRRLVRRALAALPTEQREAVELAFYDGLSHREIADRLMRPLGTVKTRIRLGMAKLRDALSLPGSVR